VNSARVLFAYKPSARRERGHTHKHTTRTTPQTTTRRKKINTNIKKIGLLATRWRLWRQSGSSTLRPAFVVYVVCYEGFTKKRDAHNY